jgi:hypothetical protein
MSDRGQDFEAIHRRLVEKFNTSVSNAENLELIAAAAEVNGRNLNFDKWEACFSSIFETVREAAEPTGSFLSNREKLSLILLAARCADDGSLGRWKTEFTEVYEAMLSTFRGTPSTAEKLTMVKAAAKSTSGISE